VKSSSSQASSSTQLRDVNSDNRKRSGLEVSMSVPGIAKNMAGFLDAKDQWALWATNKENKERYSNLRSRVLKYYNPNPADDLAPVFELEDFARGHGYYNGAGDDLQSDSTKDVFRLDVSMNLDVPMAGVIGQYTPADLQILEALKTIKFLNVGTVLDVNFSSTTKDAIYERGLNLLLDLDTKDHKILQLNLRGLTTYPKMIENIVAQESDPRKNMFFEISDQCVALSAAGDLGLADLIAKPDNGVRSVSFTLMANEGYIYSVLRNLSNPSSEVEDLRIAYCAIPNEMFYGIFQAMHSEQNRIKSLDIKFADNQVISHDFVPQIADAVTHPNNKLQHLRLSGGKPASVELEGDSTGELSSIFSADLENIHNRQIAESLESENNKIENLSWDMDDDDLSAFGTALLHKNCKVTNLTLNPRNSDSLTPRALKNFAEFLNNPQCPVTKVEIIYENSPGLKTQMAEIDSMLGAAIRERIESQKLQSSSAESSSSSSAASSPSSVVSKRSGSPSAEHDSKKLRLDHFNYL